MTSRNRLQAFRSREQHLSRISQKGLAGRGPDPAVPLEGRHAQQPREAGHTVFLIVQQGHQRAEVQQPHAGPGLAVQQIEGGKKGRLSLAPRRRGQDDGIFSGQHAGDARLLHRA